MGGLLSASPPPKLTVPCGWQDVGVVWRILDLPSFGGFFMFLLVDKFKALLLLNFALSSYDLIAYQKFLYLRHEYLLHTMTGQDWSNLDGVMKSLKTESYQAKQWDFRTCWLH